VAESLAHGLRVHASAEQLRCMSVPQIVEPRPGQLQLVAESAEVSGHRPRRQRSPDRVGQDHAVVLPHVSNPHHLFGLHFALPAQEVDDEGRQVDCRTLPVCRCTNPIPKTKENKPLFEVVTGEARRGESAIGVLLLLSLAPPNL
jgi:hypothetical protein